MLVTQQPLFRRFWYAVMPIGHLADGPKPFVLLGEPIVLWLDAAGRPAAIADRCCHRSARLSKGSVSEGRIACAYHGWVYDRSGACVHMPQAPERKLKFRVPSFRCEERYGYVWVCLGEPLLDIPALPEYDDPNYRKIDEFYEVWACNGIRITENHFDNAHFSFVHSKSFGDSNPEPAGLALDPFDGGFVMRASYPVRNPELQRQNLRMAEEWTVRNVVTTWWLPFTRFGRITYPSGLTHILCTVATPIDDIRSMVVQWVLRNDTEADASAETIIAFDRQVTLEDKEILEQTTYDTPLDLGSGEEFHMPSDRPGVEIRRRLLELITAHGEQEARGVHPERSFAPEIMTP